jgi:hypothetical protein
MYSFTRPSTMSARTFKVCGLLSSAPDDHGTVVHLPNAMTCGLDTAAFTGKTEVNRIVNKASEQILILASG